MKRIAALIVVVLLAVAFAASAHAASWTISVECFDADGSAWFVPVELGVLVDRGQADACAPLLGEGPLPPPLPPAGSAASEEAPVDTGGVDVGLGADPNIAPDPSLYATEVLCPDGSIWAVAIGDEFVCPASP